MKALLQRVDQASVTVNQQIIASIDGGLLIFLAVELNDSIVKADKLANKTINYRIFPDQSTPMNKSVLDANKSVLVVSQFTLAADTSKGLRASLSTAANPEKALQLYQHFIATCKATGVHLVHGRFGANMKVQLVNDGPVTFLLTT